MNYVKKSRFLVLFLLLLSFISLGHSSGTSFEYGNIETLEGVVSISGKASSGSKVTLFVNGNVVESKDMIGEETVELLTGNIINYIVPAGAKLTLTNDNPGTIYQLRVEDLYSKDIALGESFTFQQYELRDYELTDAAIPITKDITVIDQLVDFRFEGVETFLVDGSNNELTFVVESLGTTESEQYVEFVTFDKFTNDITLDPNFNEITDTTEIQIAGTVSDPNVRLFYILNLNGEISNTGVFSDNQVLLDGNSFNFTLSNLVEGENTVRLISTDPNNLNLFNGENVFTVLSDRFPPSLEIVDVYFRANANSDKIVKSRGDDILTNSKNLILNISSDATILNYTFNDDVDVANFENGFVQLELNLEDGQNNLTLTVIDIAGNINKESHEIHFDDERPRLIRESLEPEEVFDGTARFFFEKIEGQTNKPNVKMTIFTIVDGQTDFDGNPLTCQNFENLFLRNLGNLGRGFTDNPELELNDTQISLLGLAHRKVETTSNSEGKFDAVISFQERSFDSSDYFDGQDFNNDQNQQVDSVASRNFLCVVMEDDFGNIEMERFSVTLNAGNTLWRADEITTIPNTVYAAEIEQADASRGNGRVEFGLIAKFQYTGPGEVTRLTRFTVREDTRAAEDTKGVDVRNNGVNFRLDKSTGELIAFIPVQVEPQRIDPLDYPSELKLSFAATVGYEVNEVGVQVDERNPIFFQTSINIERPLDHTKWLTPSTIEDIQGFLNTTIDGMEKFTNAMRWASVGGIVACTGAKFYYGAQMRLAQTPEERNDLLEKMYLICDRVVGTPSPQLCEGNLGTFDDDSTGILKIDGNDRYYTGGDDALGEAAVYASEENNEEILARFDNVRIKGECSFSGGRDEQNNPVMDGVIIQGDVLKYENNGGSWISPDTESREFIRDRCVPASYKGPDGNIVRDANGNRVLQEVDLKGASGVCFTDQAPQLDQTRCNFFGADNNNKHIGDVTGGVPGWNPKDNIIESIRCGVVTDTYSHSKKLLSVMEEMYLCLEQAKVGDVEGSYCERLLSHAVCDVVTNVLFNTLQQESTRTDGQGNDGRSEAGFLDALRGAEDGDKLLNDRYQGSFFTQSGLSTKQVSRKFCGAALTGDWSALTDNLLASIDQNEVRPTFGPMFPVSRMMGYNPITGDLTIQYRFTYGVVSGGQTVNSEIQYYCDSTAPGGEFCPENQRLSSDDLSQRVRRVNLFANRGETVQETIVITDDDARFRFNVIGIKHKYTLNGETVETEEIFENVIHKGELFQECRWDGGFFGTGVAGGTSIEANIDSVAGDVEFSQEFAYGGLRCDTLFSDNSLLAIYEIDQDRTRLVPENRNSRATYYPGNDIIVDLNYDIRNNAEGNQNQFNLYYYAKCPGNNGGAFGSRTININTVGGENVLGRQLVKLMDNKVPAFGFQDTRSFVTASAQISGNEEIKDILVKKITDVEDLSTSFTLRSIMVDGTVVDGSINVIINDAGGVASTLITDLNTRIGQFAGQNSNGNADVVLNLDTAASGIQFILVTESGRQIPMSALLEQEGLEVTEDLENIQPGTCNIELRLLPEDIRIASYEDFQNYEPFGEDIQVDRSIVDEGLWEGTFTVARTPKDTVNDEHIFSFDVTSPLNQASLCVQKEEGEEVGHLIIPLQIVAQTSEGVLSFDRDIKPLLSVSMRLDRFNWNYNEESWVDGLTLNPSTGAYELKIVTADLPKLEGVTTGTLTVTYDESLVNTNTEPKVIQRKININNCN